MVRLVRRAFVVLAAAALTLCPGIVFAGALPVPVHAVPTAAVPAGLQSTVTFDARGIAGPAANAGYYSRPVLVSNNTLGGLARGLARRALPVAAFVAAVEAAGWAIDELTQQVIVPAVEGQPLGSVAWCNTGYDPMPCGPSAESFLGYTPPGYPGPLVSMAFTSATTATLVTANDWSYTVREWNVPSNAQNITGSPQSTVPDVDLAAFIKANPHIWSDAMHNADGSVNRNPDVQAAAQALADELAATDPAQQPDPSQGWDSGQQYGDEPAPGGAASEWPGFCTWATVVCDFVDWVTDETFFEIPEDPPAVPVVDVPVTTSNWSSGLGAGSCPADIEFGLSIGSYTADMGEACTLIEGVRPFVILTALIIGAYIVAGVRTNG